MPKQTLQACALVLFALTLCWMPKAAPAAQIRAVRVRRQGTHFTITMRVEFSAPPWAVFAALQDYAAMPHYNPDLRRVRIEPTGEPNRVRLFTTVHACVLIFCRTLHQEQIMTAMAGTHGGVLRATLVPHGGSFRGGNARWVVRPCRTRHAPTCLDARIELQPAFWVPPLIGPWILRHKMYQEARRSGYGLQRIAAKLLARSAHAPELPLRAGGRALRRPPAQSARGRRFSGVLPPRQSAPHRRG